MFTFSVYFTWHIFLLMLFFTLVKRSVFNVYFISLQALISERNLELERLKVYYNSLHKTEMEQNEIIHRFTKYH